MHRLIRYYRAFDRNWIHSGWICCLSLYSCVVVFEWMLRSFYDPFDISIPPHSFVKSDSVRAYVHFGRLLWCSLSSLLQLPFSFVNRIELHNTIISFAVSMEFLFTFLLFTCMKSCLRLCACVGKRITTIMFSNIVNSRNKTRIINNVSIFLFKKSNQS